MKAQGEFTLTWERIQKLGQGSSLWLGEHTLLAQLADTAAELRNLDGLQEYAPRAEERALHYGHSLFLGIARRARGIERLLVGDHAPSEAYLRRALALFQKHGARWQIGRTQLALGDLALARSNISEARDDYSSALAEFESLRAVRYIAQARNALKHTN